MTPGPGIEPRTHWWKASAHTTAPSQLSRFALTSSSFSERPLLYEIMGGSKISFSSGCRSIKCHLLMSICFKLGTAGWNCVTKKQDPFGFFLFFSEGLFSSFVFYFREIIFHKVNWVASLGQTFLKVVYFLLK